MDMSKGVNFANNNPPVRIYLRKEDMTKAYGNNYVSGATDYVTQFLKNNSNKLVLYQYLIGIVSNEINNKVIDFYGYRGIKDWPGNPTIDYFQIEDGQNVHKSDSVIRTISRGDIAEILGAEENHRRNTWNLRQYITHEPIISNERNIIEFLEVR